MLARYLIVISLYYIVLSVLVSTVCCVDYQDDASFNDFVAWAKAVLGGVTYLPKIGKPSQSLSIGPRSLALLSGKTLDDTILVVAELANGRILHVTEGGYFSSSKDPNVQVFQENARKWVTRNKYSSSGQICEIKTDFDMSCLDNRDTLVAIYSTKNDYDNPAATARMKEWVKQGGGFIHAVNARAWKGFSKNTLRQQLSHLPFSKLLLEAGILVSWITAEVDGTGKFMANITIDGVAAFDSVNLYFYDHQLKGVVDIGNFGTERQREFDLACDSDPQHSLSAQLEMMDFMGSLLDKLAPTMDWPHAGHRVESLSVFNFTVYLVFQCAWNLNLWHPTEDNFYFYTRDFPGPIPVDAKRESIIYELDDPVGRSDYFATGYYLGPNEETTVTILSTTVSDWRYYSVFVGMHKDYIPSDKGYLDRMVRINRMVKLRSEVTKIYAPFGGHVVVVLQSPIYEPPFKARYLKLSITNVVLAPMFDVAIPQSVEDWSERRHAPGSWGVMRCRLITFYLPAYALTNVRNPAAKCEIWDRVVRTHYELASTPISQQRHQWFVPDLQISKGVMHSGWPIMGYTDAFADNTTDKFPFAPNLKEVMNEHVGLFHEISHNLQRDHWNFVREYYAEVTVMIAATYQLENEGRRDPLNAKEGGNYYTSKLIDDELYNMVIANDFDKMLKSTQMHRLLYFTLYIHFGWNCYREMFASYETHSLLPDPPEDLQGRINNWVKRWSTIVEYNICPLYEYFTYKMTDGTCESLKKYKPFLPNDDVTDDPRGMSRVKEIEGKYPDLVRKVDPKPKCYVATYYEKQVWIDDIVKLAERMFKSMERFKNPRSGPGSAATADSTVGKFSLLRNKYKPDPRDRTGTEFLIAGVSGLFSSPWWSTLFAAYVSVYICLIS